MNFLSLVIALSLHQVRRPISEEAARRGDSWGERLDPVRRAVEGDTSGDR